MKTGVYPCYENQFRINKGTTEKEDMKEIKDCVSFSVSFDNGVEEWRRLLTAKSVKITVSAKRNVGDPGNDLVASLAWVNGRDAEKDIAWTFPDGTEVNFLGAVINVTNVGAGDSTAVAPLEFEIQSNGKPEVIPASE